MTRTFIALASFLVAGLLTALGPYARVREVMSPRQPFEESPAENADVMRSELSRIGEDGRVAYKVQLVWDTVVVAANFVWLWIWIGSVSRRVLRRGAETALPIVAAGAPTMADLSENLLLGAVVLSFPEVPHGVAWAASTATRAKFLLLGFGVLCGLCMSIAAVASAIAKQRMRRRGDEIRARNAAAGLIRETEVGT